MPTVVGFKLRHYRSDAVGKNHRAAVRDALKKKVGGWAACGTVGWDGMRWDGVGGIGGWIFIWVPAKARPSIYHGATVRPPPQEQGG